MPVNHCKTDVVVTYGKDPEVGKNEAPDFFWLKLYTAQFVIELLLMGWIYPIDIHLNLGKKKNNNK